MTKAQLSLPQLAEQLTGLHRQIASAYRPKLEPGRLCSVCQTNLDEMLIAIGSCTTFVADIVADSPDRAEMTEAEEADFRQMASRLVEAQQKMFNFKGCAHEHTTKTERSAD